MPSNPYEPPENPCQPPQEENVSSSEGSLPFYTLEAVIVVALSALFLSIFYFVMNPPF